MHTQGIEHTIISSNFCCWDHNGQGDWDHKASFDAENQDCINESQPFSLLHVTKNAKNCYIFLLLIFVEGIGDETTNKQVGIIYWSRCPYSLPVIKSDSWETPQ